jgi:hypothetical protein
MGRRNLCVTPDGSDAASLPVKPDVRAHRVRLHLKLPPVCDQLHVDLASPLIEDPGDDRSDQPGAGCVVADEHRAAEVEGVFGPNHLDNMREGLLRRI